MIASLRQYVSDPASLCGGLLFVVNAIVFGNWAVRIPHVMQLLGLTHEDLGKALLFSPAGVIIAASPAAWSIRRYGVGRISIITGALMCAVMIGMGYVSSYNTLCTILFLYGISHGAFDVATNAYVTAVEKEQNNSIMSTSHGFWSLGAMIGAMLGAQLLPYIDFSTQMWLGSITGMLLLLYTARHIANRVDATEEAHTWRYPGNWALFLAGFVFVIFMVEGSIADWAAVYYKEYLRSPEVYLGFGFGAFSGAMAMMRFRGDAMIERYPIYKLLAICAIGVGICLLLFSVSVHIVMATIVMLMCGTSCSILVPVVFRLSARLDGVASSAGIAFVSSIGYFGFLAGPPLIGYLSHQWGLDACFAGLGVVTALCGIYILLSKANTIVAKT